MKHNIHYTVAALNDLDEIWDYIAFDLQNPTAAERTVNAILDAVDQLTEFAEIGVPLESIVGVGQDYRILVTGNYLTFYRAQGKEVYVDRVLYGRRDYLSILFGEMLGESQVYGKLLEAQAEDADASKRYSHDNVMGGAEALLRAIEEDGHS